MASSRDNGPRGTESSTDVYDRLSAAERQSPLDPSDLERFARAAYLIGRDSETLDLLGRAHGAFLARGDGSGAARCAFWLAFLLQNNNEGARAAGWLARARRLLEEGGYDCVECGYLLLPAALQHVRNRDLAAAGATFAEAARIGDRFGDPDLVNLARAGRGRTLIGAGEVAAGVALLDETMVAVTSGELSPIAAGTVYCSVISACFDMFDLGRAQEWTEALNRWCASHPDLVPYRGECLVHRAEIMRLHGGWRDALEEARRACEWFARPPGHAAMGAAYYQLAELHRLRGDFAGAEEAYRAAGQAGRTPHPGLALLRLAQGRLEDARAAIARVVEETRDRRTRTTALAAFTEILLALGDLPAARKAADELATIARAPGAPFPRALAAHAASAVSLAEGDACGALSLSREAVAIWGNLEAPYEMARSTVVIGLACRALGDNEGALMELNAAAAAFARLEAAPDLASVETLLKAERGSAGGLTARELEVLALLAGGKTNRAIGAELQISEKTVARHVSNIFSKLNLSSRAAATAYAFRHGLV